MSILRSFLSVIVLVTLGSAVPLITNVDAPDYSEILRDESAKVDYRLPQNVKPENYAIWLTPNIVPDHFTFTGESEILITVLNATNTITLHAKNLTISLRKLENLKNSTAVFILKNQKHDDVTDFEILEFTKEILPGNYRLSMSFEGILHDDLNGFYRSSYTNERGETV